MILTQEHRSYKLAFIVLEGVMEATRGENNHYLTLLCTLKTTNMTGMTKYMHWVHAGMNVTRLGNHFPYVRPVL